MLSNDAMGYMRSHIENNLLPDTCTILSLTQTPDGQGQFTETWGTVSTGVKCRLDRVAGYGSKRFEGASLQTYASLVLSLPYGTNITEQNHVLFGGNQYSVEAVDNEKSWAAVIRAELKEL